MAFHDAVIRPKLLTVAIFTWIETQTFTEEDSEVQLIPYSIASDAVRYWEFFSCLGKSVHPKTAYRAYPRRLKANWIPHHHASCSTV